MSKFLNSFFLLSLILSASSGSYATRGIAQERKEENKSVKAPMSPERQKEIGKIFLNLSIGLATGSKTSVIKAGIKLHKKKVTPQELIEFATIGYSETEKFLFKKNFEEQLKILEGEALKECSIAKYTQSVSFLIYTSLAIYNVINSQQKGEDLSQMKAQQAALENELEHMLSEGESAGSPEVLEVQTQIDNLREEIIHSESLQNKSKAQAKQYGVNAKTAATLSAKSFTKICKFIK